MTLEQIQKAQRGFPLHDLLPYLFWGLTITVVATCILHLFHGLVKPEVDDILFGRISDLGMCFTVFFVVAPVAALISAVWSKLTHEKELLDERELIQDWINGVRTRRVFGVFYLCLLISGFVIGGMQIDCWFRLKPDRLEVNEFLTLGTKSWPLTDVRQLIQVRSCKAPIGGYVHRNWLRIIMADGYEFSTKQADYEFFRQGQTEAPPISFSEREDKKRKRQIEKEMLAQLSQATGLPIEIEDPASIEE